MKPSTAERVREMTAQRVRLEQQRSEVDQKVGTLEKQEREAFERGRSAATDVEKKQVAGSLMRVRRELKRLHAQAGMFTQQIDVIGTHIHHLTLSEQGRRMELPKAEDLTREAAQAERVMAELSANADLAHSIEVGASTPLMAEEEAAILAELNAAPPQAEPAAREAARSGASAKAEPAGMEPTKSGQAAKPELS
jgi:hypothetical protein